MKHKERDPNELADFINYWNVKIDPYNFMFSFFNGLFRCGPETLEDIEEYYNIDKYFLLHTIDEALKSSGHQSEIDIKISNVRSLFPKKESNWELQIVDSATGNKIVSSVFFTGLPFAPLKLETKV